jgi:hypothetical protein
MKAKYSSWLFLLLIAAIIVIPPGVLPFWLLQDGPMVYNHFYLCMPTFLNMTCLFSSIEAASSTAILNNPPPAKLLIAWLAKSMLPHKPPFVSLFEKGWLSLPPFSPPRIPFARSVSVGRLLRRLFWRVLL